MISKAYFWFALVAITTICYAEETSKEGVKIGNWIVTRQEPPEHVEWMQKQQAKDGGLLEDASPQKPKNDEQRQIVTFDLSEWVRTKLAMKNFTVNLDQLSLPTFDFSRPYAYQLSIYIPVVYSLIGLGYFLSFLFPGSFGLARRSDSILSGLFGSRDDDSTRAASTSDDQANFDYAALDTPNAYYADDYVDNAFQQAEGGAGNGGSRNSRRRTRNRRQNGGNSRNDYAATARMGGSSFNWADVISNVISKVEQWLTQVGTEERQQRATN